MANFSHFIVRREKKLEFLRFFRQKKPSPIYYKFAFKCVVLTAPFFSNCAISSSKTPNIFFITDTVSAPGRGRGAGVRRPGVLPNLGAGGGS
mmetsp:Transcript_24114/g.37575  ORF Transcript_24114/g.37575 Transcript_24114/m.37575 type:complete len:92 (-) Transcript_24114:943-1218(-)